MITVRHMILSLVMLFCQMFIFLSIYVPRKNTRKFWSICIGFYLADVIVYIGTIFLLGPVRAAQFMVLTTTVPCLLFYFFMGKYKDGRFWVTYCITDMIISAVNVTTFIIVLMIWGDSFWPVLIGRCAAMLLAAAVVIRFLSKPYKHAMRVMERGWNLIGVVMLIFYAVLAFYTSFPTPIDGRPDDYVLTIIWMLTIMLAFAVFIWIILSVGKTYDERLAREEERSELALARMVMRQSQIQYETLSDNIEKNRMLRHDMSHHLKVVQSLCEQQKYAELKDYIHSINTESLSQQLPYYSENEVVNGLVGYYQMEAEKQQTKFRYQIHIPADVPKDPACLGVLLGNGLSNALEAAGKVKENSYIELNIRYDNRKLILVIKNSYDGTIVEGEDGLLSTKTEDGHGIGIRSMKRTAEEYHGYFDYQYTKQEFILNIVLQV